jgi:hypothetical protein
MLAAAARSQEDGLHCHGRRHRLEMRCAMPGPTHPSPARWLRPAPSRACRHCIATWPYPSFSFSAIFAVPLSRPT